MGDPLAPSEGVPCTPEVEGNREGGGSRYAFSGRAKSYQIKRGV
jgi:hypothetical protein